MAARPEDEALEVRVTPRARRNEVVGVREGVVQLRVTAVAEKGRANAAVRRLIAARLGVPISEVTLLRGERSRVKVLRVEGLSAQQARRRLVEGS